MRRYRFGGIAATLAGGYVAVTVAAGVIALVTGDPTLLRGLVTDEWYMSFVPYTWWVEVLLVACGFLQGWAYWQVFRGRLKGDPGIRSRPVRLLRAALYFDIAYGLLFELPIPYQWWLGVPHDLVQFAIIWLFFVVLADALPRWLRLLGLVAGLLDNVRWALATVASALGPGPLDDFVWRLPPVGLLNVIWLVTVLVGQGRDPRWSRATVRLGVLAAWLSFLFPGGGYAFITFGGVSYIHLAMMLSGALNVFSLVWAARSAHELAGPPPQPSAPAAPARAARRPWPLAALAVVPPLIPAAVNLIAYGMPMWIGPRGAVESSLYQYPGGQAYLLWLAVDLLVGVGAPAVLVAIAAVRRSRRLLRGTMWTLLIVAAAGVLTVLTIDPEDDWGFFPQFDEERLRFFPDGLFVPDRHGQLPFGLSPLWFSAALAASALMLFLLYTRPPATRTRAQRFQVLVTALGTFTALCLLPSADHAHGPAGERCAPPDWDRVRMDMRFEEPTGPRAFICSMRTYQVIKGAETMPDLDLLAYGHTLCGVYTRNDPGELARVRAVNGVDVRGLAGALAEICPAAAATVKAERAAQDREFAAMEAEEQRKCDATPRHRPRIRPAKAIRLKEPEWPEAGLELYDPEAEDSSRDAAARYPSDGLVSGGPTHLILGVRSDFRVCVTLETYTRRPPVEVKGWDEVIEVGYHSPTGDMTFSDGLTGTELPDLSLNGRKGHYRIRVHYAWFPWKGDKYGTQRLLIMAWPGRGDKLITYRQRSRR